MRQHNALAFARCARGVHKRAHFIGIYFRAVFAAVFLDELRQRVSSVNRSRILHGDKYFKAGAFFEHVRNHGLLRFVKYNGRGVSAVDQLMKLRRRQRCVERHRNACAVYDTEIAYYPVVAAHAYNGDVLAGKAELFKSTAYRFAVGTKL